MTRYKKHVVLVGTARSGTSWLSELIARKKRYRLLFEPEHETRTEKGYLICDQYITVDNVKKDTRHYLRRIFKNRVDSDWIAQNSNRKFKRHLWPFIPKKYIIKFVRANLAAQYINENFRIPVIHIIRNPYDVIKSQKRSHFPWLTDLSRFSQQGELVDLIRLHFDFDITNYESLSTSARLTLRWCIENVSPLEVQRPYDYLSSVIKYEALKQDVTLFKSLCVEFNLEPIANIDEVYKKPSSKTHKNSSIRTKSDSNQELADKEIVEISNVLRIFRTELYPIMDV